MMCCGCLQRVSPRIAIAVTLCSVRQEASANDGQVSCSTCPMYVVCQCRFSPVLLALLGRVDLGHLRSALGVVAPIFDGAALHS